MSTVGKKLLSAIVKTGDMNGFMTLGLHPGLFKESELVLYEFMTSHVMKHGVIPAQDTIEDKYGEVIVDTSEPSSFYMEEVEKRFIHSNMKALVNDAAELLKDGDSQKAYDLALGMMTEMQMMRNRKSLFNFSNAAAFIYKEYMYTKSMPDHNSVSFGWPSLDHQTGGLRAGDFASVVGRPAQGKTFNLLYMALHGWMHSGHTPLFVSMEMSSTIIQQRLAAMQTHTPLTHLLKGMLTTKDFKQMMSGLSALKDKAPLWVLDSNLAGTVDDLVMLCRQLKPTSLYVDGAYMLQHPNSKLDKFTKIGENANAMKQRIASDLGIPTVASYQFGRSAVKKGKGKKDEGDIGLDDIYGSDVIGQVSSVVLGMLQKDSVETKVQRTISLLKGRNGESGQFDIHWNFYDMDFSEINPPKDPHSDDGLKEPSPPEYKDLEFV